jgi:transketolase C-terminal domain/subunit
MSEATPGFIDHCSGIDGELFEMFEPADAQEAAEITRLVVERTLREGNPGHPIYMRCTRHNVAHLDRSGIPNYQQKLLEGSYEIPIKTYPTPPPSPAGGEGVSRKSPLPNEGEGPGEGGPDLVLVASGAVVLEALKAAEQLVTQGIQMKLINVVSINKIQKQDSAFLKSLPDNVPVVTAHDAEPYALSHRVQEAINVARKLGRQPGIVQRALGVNVSPRSNHVGSGSTEENYRRNQIDAAGITQTIKEILKK